VCEESPNIYPTFTYADDPARFVEGEATQQVFERNVGAKVCGGKSKRWPVRHGS
jgi:hypothetical protein